MKSRKISRGTRTRRCLQLRGRTTNTIRRAFPRSPRGARRCASPSSLGAIKGRSHGPPDARQAPRDDELGSKEIDDLLLPISLEKRPRARHPKIAGNAAHHVLDENEQIVRMPFRGRHRRVVHDFEIDEPRPAAGLVVDEVAHVRIAVRPGAAEIRAKPGMRPAQLVGGRDQHRRRDRPVVQMAGEIHARHFVRGHPSVAHGESAR